MSDDKASTVALMKVFEVVSEVRDRLLEPEGPSEHDRAQARLKNARRLDDALTYADEVLWPNWPLGERGGS